MAAKQLIFARMLVRPSSGVSPNSQKQSPRRSRRKARNVVLDKKFGSPTVTKDGVTVAKEIELEDRIRKHGRPDGPRSRQQNQRCAGDGTTPATVLAEADYREGRSTSPLRQSIASSAVSARPCRFA